MSDLLFGMVIAGKEHPSIRCARPTLIMRRTRLRPDIVRWTCPEVVDTPRFDLPLWSRPTLAARRACLSCPQCHTAMSERQASETLYAAVYQQLKRLARRELQAGRGKTTINTTELVHEAFLKLGQGGAESWENEAHFFGAAARAMREVLVDFARRRQAIKRGGGWSAVSLSDAEAAVEVEADEMLSLDRALNQLNDIDERLRHVVELRFFGGVPEADIARLLGVSARTVERDWIKARLFLRQAMKTA